MSDTLLNPKNRFTWSLLAFQGGFINIGGFLSLHVFVSHVTGFASLLAMEMVKKNFIQFFVFLLVPIFFLLGSFLSSIFTEVRKKREGSPIYIHILIFLATLFLGISLIGELGHFGIFGDDFGNTKDYILLSLLSLACGMQNAIFTHYSKSIIRTTHLTGITTDLGIGLAKTLIGKDVKEKQFNRIRINLIFSFIIGSICGVLLFSRIQYLGFVVPSLLSLFVGLRLYFTRAKLTSL